MPAWECRFCGKISVLRPEGVFTYVEQVNTEIRKRGDIAPLLRFYYYPVDFWGRRFCGKIFVLRPEGVFTYVEQVNTKTITKNMPPWECRFCGKIFVLRPEGVFTYIEQANTEAITKICRLGSADFVGKFSFFDPKAYLHTSSGRKRRFSPKYASQKNYF